jgi:iron complex outermembrane recepter protein
MFHSHFRARRLAACIAALCAPAPYAFAQSEPSPAVQTIIITGNPFASSTFGRAESSLQGDALADRLRATLGETLAAMPGVSSSYFGPTASRPIIRGLDGERVRVLENGAASVDAASLSPDHAVPIEPLSIARIEVLRGPAALLYGSNAIGGVVNALSNRIPRERKSAFGADVSLSGASGDRARTAAGRVQGGAGAFAFHVDASTRESDDVRTPTFELDGETRDRIVNSALRANSFALGASAVNHRGFIGASVDRYDSKYGIVASDDVTIDMQRTRLTLAGATQFARVGSFSDLSGNVVMSDYKHAEIEGNGEIGTRFANKGLEWRLEAKTRTIGAWRGIVGASGERTRFTAVGEEAFVPPNTTNVLAAFGLAQWKQGASEANVGTRVETHRVRTSVTFGDDGEPRFGEAQSKRNTLVSASASFAQTLGAGIIARAALAHTERAPTYFERFADGVHIATAAYERGDANLPKETADHFELGFAWSANAHSVKANVYTTRFKNFIALEPTGETFEEEKDEGEHEEFPIYAFRAVPARFVGFEFESSTRVLSGARTLDLTTRWDATRATNRESGEPLPRIAPMRIGAGAVFAQGGWRASAEVMHAFAQKKVPTAQLETPTESYTLLNASLSYAFSLGGNASGKLALRGTNLTNALGYSATSFAQVRERAPLPGRGVGVSLDVSF